MAYSGDHAHDEIRSDINVGSFQMQSVYRRTSSGSQPGLINPGHAHSRSHSGTGGGPIPNHMNHYRSVSIGSGSPGGVPSSVPSGLSSSYSHSGELGMSWPLTPSVRAGGAAAVVESQKTPPQRRVNYVRHEIKGQHTPAPGNLQGGCSLSYSIQHRYFHVWANIEILTRGYSILCSQNLYVQG